MKTTVWTNAIKDSADPQRAKQFLDLLAATSAAAAVQAASAEQARIIAALLSGSQALSNLLLARPDWLSLLEPEVLKFPRRKQGMRNEMGRWLKPLLASSDFGTALMRLREFKQREMLRIAGRDLARFGKLPEVVQDISDVADVCLDGVWQVCYRQLTGASRATLAPGCQRGVATHRWVRPGHGQARRAGAQLQLGCGCAVRLQRGRGRVQGASRQAARPPGR